MGRLGFHFETLTVQTLQPPPSGGRSCAAALRRGAASGSSSRAPEGVELPAAALVAARAQAGVARRPRGSSGLLLCRSRRARRSAQPHPPAAATGPREPWLVASLRRAPSARAGGPSRALLVPRRWAARPGREPPSSASGATPSAAGVAALGATPSAASVCGRAPLAGGPPGSHGRRAGAFGSRTVRRDAPQSVPVSGLAAPLRSVAPSPRLAVLLPTPSPQTADAAAGSRAIRPS
jgi:hypothetical protein